MVTNGTRFLEDWFPTLNGLNCLKNTLEMLEHPAADIEANTTVLDYWMKCP